MAREAEGREGVCRVAHMGSTELNLGEPHRKNLGRLRNPLPYGGQERK